MAICVYSRFVKHIVIQMACIYYYTLYIFFKIQHWLDDDSTEKSAGIKESYLTQTCSRIHIPVNVKRGNDLWPSKLVAISNGVARFEYFGSRQGKF